MSELDLIELFPFSYYDEIRRRWVRARYKARIEDIRARYAHHRIDGPPERREGGMGQFTPPTSQKG